MHVSTRVSFANEAELASLLPALRNSRCHFCGRRGTWIGHGWAYGYGPDGTPGVVRGRRILCTNRGRRDGCGRTQTVLLATMGRHFMASTTLLWSLLEALASGESVRGFWASSTLAHGSLTLRTGHRLAVRLRQLLSLLNPRLVRLVDPPGSRCRDPIGGLVAHLRAAFPQTKLAQTTDPLAALQRATHRGLFDAA